MFDTSPVSPGATDALARGTAATRPPAATGPALRIDSRGLLQGRRELIIDHTGLEYRLQVTRNGKLILTK